MDFISYVVSALFALFGIFLGSVLANYYPQEVHNIKKYFPLIQMVSLIFLFFVIFTYFPFFVSVALLVLTFAFLRLFWHKQDVNILDYIVFGTIFPITSLILEAHIYVTLILFAFGIFSGALFYVLHTIPKKKMPRHVAHHKHKGRHHSFDEILSKLFSYYVFFLVLTFLSFLMAHLFKLLIV